MTTKEAIQAMLDGKKLTSERWDFYKYIYFDGEGFRYGDNRPITLSDISDFSEHLEVYEEPKTVIIERWLCKACNKDGIEGDCLFTTEGNANEIQAYREGRYSSQLVQLLDTYEITLEG